MRSASYRCCFYAFAWAMASIFAGCRNPQRDLPPEAAAGTVVVQLDNLDSSDRNQAGYIYLLTGCLPNVTGVLNAGVVSFTAKGIRNALEGCSMQIKTTQPLPGAKFAAGADPAVIYSAQLSTFYLDITGALAAVAPLNKLYSTGNAPLSKGPSSPGTTTGKPTVPGVPAPAAPPDSEVTIGTHQGTN